MMLAEGILCVTRRGAVQRDGSLPSTATPLERAIYSQLYTRTGVAALRQAPKVRHALADLRMSLVDRGLMLSPRRRNTARVAILLGWALVGWSLVGQVLDDASVLRGVFAGLVATFGTVLWLFSNRTEAGYKAVRKLRHQYPKPVGKVRVDTGTVDIGEVGVRAALYGGWTADVVTSPGVMRGVLSDSFSGGDSLNGGASDGGDSSGGY